MLKVGDAIKCNDEKDAIRTMNALFGDDIHTDFLYEKRRGTRLVAHRGEG